MRFKEWLKIQEIMTSTSCIASVPKMLGAGKINRRWWASSWEDKMNGKNHNKKTKFAYMVPQVSESITELKK